MNSKFLKRIFKISLLFIGIVSVYISHEYTILASNNDNGSERINVPMKFVNTKWEATNNKHKHRYFDISEKYIDSYTSNKDEVISYNLSYIKFHSGYIIVGRDINHKNKDVWWFIRQMKNNKLQIGYVNIKHNKVPSKYAGYYAKYTAKKIL